MTIDVRLVDGYGGKNAAKIDEEGQINVVVHPHPPVSESLTAQPFRQYFTDDGASSGSNSMRVDGSTTPVPFYISSNNEYDVYIKYISVVIGDGGSPALNKYGALTALTNGVTWSTTSNEIGDYELHDGIKTNLEFIRIGGDTASIGTGVDSFLADVSGGGTEKSYMPNIDLKETFGLQYGIRLKKSSTDRMMFTVNDDLTGLTTHNIIAYGIRIPVPVGGDSQ